jgi:hypothetical protein
MLAEPQTEQAPATYAAALLAGRIALLDSARRLLPDVPYNVAGTAHEPARERAPGVPALEGPAVGQGSRRRRRPVSHREAPLPDVRRSMGAVEVNWLYQEGHLWQ